MRGHDDASAGNPAPPAPRSDADTAPSTAARQPAAPHTVLVSGTAGAGRTTLAAATACAAAASGARTLLLSPEPHGRLARLLGGAPGRFDALAARAADDLPGGAPGAAGAEQAAAQGDFDIALGARPVPGALGVWAARIDPAGEFRSRAVDWQDRGRQALEMLGASPMGADELTELPGAEALALLHALRAAHPEECQGPPHAAGCRWDTVVVDLPEVQRALQLLALPGQLRRYLRRLLPPERQAARALRPVFAQLAGVPMPGPWLYEAAASWERGLAAVQRVVESQGTVLRLAVDPSESAAESLRLARAGAGLHGLHLDTVLVNRLVPGASSPMASASATGQRAEATDAAADAEAAGHPGATENAVTGRDTTHTTAHGYGAGPTPTLDAWAAALARRQQAVLAGVRADCVAARVAVVAVPHRGEEPCGPGELTELLAAGHAGVPHAEPAGAYGAERLGPHGVVEDRLAEGGSDGQPNLALDPPPEALDGAGEAGRLVWRLAVPGAVRGELELVRRGDELAVTVGPYRRVLTLPSALRRCRVVGAALEGGELRVRWDPDPALWPNAASQRQRSVR